MASSKQALLLTFQLLCCSSSAQVRLEVKSYSKSYQLYYDVFVTTPQKTINLTRFPTSWEAIVDIEVSPDSNYCFVRHKPNQKNMAYRLALYDLKNFKRINEIIPGSGGDFEWNNNSQIIHHSGCGTNCANFLVYDKQLKIIFYTLSSGGFKYSPQKNFVVQFSMYGDKIWVYDLRSLKDNPISKTYTTKLDMEYDWDDFQFIDDNNIVIVKPDGLKPLLKINLTKVDWRNIDPKNIGEFYERKL